MCSEYEACVGSIKPWLAQISDAVAGFKYAYSGFEPVAPRNADSFCTKMPAEISKSMFKRLLCLCPFHEFEKCFDPIAQSRRLVCRVVQ